VGENISRSQVFARQNKQANGSFTSRGTTEGTSRIMSYRTMEDYPYIVMVGTAKAEVLVPVRKSEDYLAAAATSALIVLFAIVVIIAFSRQQRALNSLADSEARYHASFDQAAIGLAHTRMDGSYLRVNRKLCEMLGYSEAELLATNYVNVTHPDDSATSKSFRSALLANSPGPSSTIFEKRYFHKDGSTVCALIALTLVRHADGTPDYFLSMVDDITQRKRAEAEVLLLNQELESRVKHRTRELSLVVDELEAFAYSVSHDLRAPLQRISGVAELMSKKGSGEISEGMRHYLDLIVGESRRMADMIADLLQLARVKRGDLNFAWLNLSAIAHEVLHLLAENDPARVVELVVQPNIHAVGDPGLLRIAFENLLGNAWKYSAHCSVARIEFSATEQGGEIIYRVRDNGIGFDMAQVDKLFVAFRRLHSDKEFPGTGIGLVSVKRVIQRHHGRIWLESAPGTGTSVFFTLAAGAAIDAKIISTEASGD
jgi:PAS domain S-box-containing protein